MEWKNTLQYSTKSENQRFRIFAVSDKIFSCVRTQYFCSRPACSSERERAVSRDPGSGVEPRENFWFLPIWNVKSLILRPFFASLLHSIRDWFWPNINRFMSLVCGISLLDIVSGRDIFSQLRKFLTLNFLNFNFFFGWSNLH